MNFSSFFIWCAGSDTDLLKNCSKAERNKHMGFGSLVLVPAILGLISMSFALSTIEGIQGKPWIYILGGTVWSLIIFAFDRFIVSTHRRKMKDVNELKSPAFFLRLFFALVLGIVISHPLVMLYFDGSVQDQIAGDVVKEQQLIELNFDAKIETIQTQLSQTDSSISLKEAERNAQSLIVAKEIDGEVIKNAQGEITTTGLYGKGPSAENKIAFLKQLQLELNQLKQFQQSAQKIANQQIKLLETKKDSTIAAFSVSTDYLRRELALERLKENNSIVGTTQFLLMLLFIMVDLLPFIFKTFAPFGMYDRILQDDLVLIQELDNQARKIHLEKVYREINVS
jgi:hypothetical protein